MRQNREKIPIVVGPSENHFSLQKRVVRKVPKRTRRMKRRMRSRRKRRGEGGGREERKGEDTGK